MIDKEALEEVINSMLTRFNAELIALTEEQLKEQWFFKWDEKANIDWNIYQFSDILEMHKRDCRQWEEHHHGHVSVVERVRDKYLMPRIIEFRKLLETKMESK